MILSQSQLEILRTQGHRTELKMSIYKPATLLACRVDSATIGRGARVIPFDTVTSGAFGNVYANAIMYIGSSAGEMDKGRIRVKSITSSVITVAENSDIDWADDLFLTIVDFIDISAIYPRIIKDPANDENVIFYKDYNIAYTNQNSVLGTFICMGSHRAADLDGGVAQLYWTSSGTYNVNGDTLTYLWEFGGFGGTSSGTSTSPDPGYITYDTPGEYKTKLTITNSSGGTDISYRYVSIHDDAHPAILKWEMDTLSGSRDSGGYTASMRVFEDITAVHPNALVVIYADDWYGTNHISLGGNQINNSQTVFVGYILENSIKYNYASGYVDFSIGSPTELMKLAEGFSISVESVVTPNTWFQIKNMTTSKAIYHYLKTHSTILNATDIRYIANDRLVQYFDTDRTSLFDAIDNFLKTGMIGGLLSDRQGTLWAEIHPEAVPNALTAISQSMTITKRDWMNSPSIEDARGKQVSFVEMGGIKYTGATSNKSYALLSNAPGIAPSYQGKTESPYEGLILSSQNQLNVLAGNYLAYQNAKYPNVSMESSGNYRNLDIVPLEKLQLTVASNDTPSGIEISAGNFHIMSMGWSYRSDKETFLPTIELHELTTGIIGETLLIPDIPPDEGYTYPPPGDFDYDDFPFNPEIIPNIIPPVVGTKVLCVLFELSKGLYYTEDFENPSPTWYQNNNGLPSGTYQLIEEMILTNTGEVYVRVGTWNEPVAGIYYAPHPSMPYTRILDKQQMCDLWNGAVVPDITIIPYYYWRIGTIGYNPNTPNTILVNINNGGGYGNGAMLLGTPNGFALSDPTLTNDYRISYSLSFGGNEWVATGSGLIAMNSAGVFLREYTGPELQQHYHTRIGDTASLYGFYNYGGTGNLIRVDNNGASMGASRNPYAVVNSMAADESDEHIMYVLGGHTPYKSDDYLSTGTVIANLPTDFYQLVGDAAKPMLSLDADKWILVGGYLGSDYLNTRNNVLFTPDFGETWESRMGNLVDFLAPSGTVDGFQFDMVSAIYI